MQSHERLLKYLRCSEDEFARVEDEYFLQLSFSLGFNGILEPGEVVDRLTFDDAVRDFQSAQRLKPDGIVGANTLWALQSSWNEQQRRTIERADADVWIRPPRSLADYKPKRDGFDRFRFRVDVLDAYNDLRAEVHDHGAIVTSSGSLRGLDASVTKGRSAKSMHYSGLAFDLMVKSGMNDAATDPYLITRDGDRHWRVWARASHGSVETLDAVIWDRKTLRTERLTETVIDFTETARRYGFVGIGQRRSFPNNYLSAEWWHFQAEFALTPYFSQFGAELLSLASTTKMSLRRYDRIWANRKRIFKRTWH